MKYLTIAGLILILLGIVGFATGGLIVTHSHTDISTNTVHITHERRSLIPLSPYLSTIALIAGVGMVVASARRR